MKVRKQGLVFKMTLLGLCLALYIVLKLVSIDLQFIKISFAGLPVIFISVVYGPLEGAFLGGLGEFIYQVFSYGITPTTALWILPPVVRALIIGFMFKQKDVKKHPVLWIVAVVLSCIAVTVINTFAIWVDAKIFHYPSNLTNITIILRFVGSIATAVLYALVTPALFEPLVKQGKLEATEN